MVEEADRGCLFSLVSVQLVALERKGGGGMVFFLVKLKRDWVQGLVFIGVRSRVIFEFD